MNLLLKFIILLGLLVPFICIADESPRETTRRNALISLSPEVRRIDARLQELGGQLDGLPAPRRSMQSVRSGYHSRLFRGPDEPAWVMIDLGRERAIDMIALIPAKVDSGLYWGSAYGFPVRFKVEVLDGEGKNPQVVADHTKEDFPNPGIFPVLVRTAALRGRYVRVTSTKHWKTIDHWLWALSEVMVVSKNRNIAVNKPVSVSGEIDTPPVWRAINLTDGQSSLGPPVAPEESPSNGFLADHAERADVEKWMQVDLGEEVKIEEIRLLPSRPTDYADNPGLGFPLRFSLQVSNDPTFANATTLRAQLDRDFINPGENAVTILADKVAARYVRFTGFKLWRQGKTYAFSLGEMQVYAGGRNVALGKKVTASDIFVNRGYQRWKPEYLVDGFNSQHRLIELPDWLNGLETRRRLQTEMQTLVIRREQSAEDFIRLVVWAVGGGVALVLLGFVWALRRQKRSRLMHTERLRQQIAADLHDDIGSNLGSIAILSEMAARDDGNSPEGREDFAEINKIAGKTAESMRDIIWLIDSDELSGEDLIRHMRQVVESLLVKSNHSFEVAGEMEAKRLPLEFRRHVFFAFKETINNIVKHAEASEVEVVISLGAKDFQFVVRDNGRGFEAREQGGGHGLNNLNRRAQALGGQCEINSEVGKGTEVKFVGRLTR